MATKVKPREMPTLNRSFAACVVCGAKPNHKGHPVYPVGSELVPLCEKDWTKKNKRSYGASLPPADTADHTQGAMFA